MNWSEAPAFLRSFRSSAVRWKVKWFRWTKRWIDTSETPELSKSKTVSMSRGLASKGPLKVKSRATSGRNGLFIAIPSYTPFGTPDKPPGPGESYRAFPRGDGRMTETLDGVEG